MKCFAMCRPDGFSAFVCFLPDGEAPAQIDGLEAIELQSAPPPPPADWLSFHVPSKSWVDHRSAADIESDAKNAAGRKRNALLSASDWTQLQDVPLATKAAWATYRQALRDITAQTGYPFNVDWPAPPS